MPTNIVLLDPLNKVVSEAVNRIPKFSVINSIPDVTLIIIDVQCESYIDGFVPENYKFHPSLHSDMGYGTESKALTDEFIQLSAISSEMTIKFFTSDIIEHFEFNSDVNGFHNLIKSGDTYIFSFEEKLNTFMNMGIRNIVEVMAYINYYGDFNHIVLKNNESINLEIHNISKNKPCNNMVNSSSIMKERLLNNDKILNCDKTLQRFVLQGFMCLFEWLLSGMTCNTPELPNIHNKSTIVGYFHTARLTFSCNANLPFIKGIILSNDIYSDYKNAFALSRNKITLHILTFDSIFKTDLKIRQAVFDHTVKKLSFYIGYDIKPTLEVVGSILQKLNNIIGRTIYSDYIETVVNQAVKIKERMDSENV